MFIDTSALVAMMLREDDADHLADRLARSETRLTSPLVILEAAMVLSSRANVNPEDAEIRIQTLLDRTGIKVASIEAADSHAAIEAFARYGKGRHPAKLNLADCLSYACARNRNLPLLYKGDDFALTDLAYAAP